MGSEARKILEEAMALSPDERTILAHEFLASVDEEREKAEEFELSRSCQIDERTSVGDDDHPAPACASSCSRSVAG